jgi:hypothetical protein
MKKVLARMNRSRLCSLAAVSLLSLSAPLAFAQDTPPSAPPTAPAPASQTARPPRGPRPNPTNIKALPKDITGDDINKLMHQFEGDLGVECAFCHFRNPETKRNDFPSDANPVKESARVMIKMTADINTRYLTQVSDRKSTEPMTCGTCHRGSKQPEVFVPKKEERANQPPAASAQPSTPPPAPN